MSETNDISRLFSHFGGHPDQYHEIGRDNLARSSEARWPLLASVSRQTAKMQAVRDMGHASATTESPASTAPTATVPAAAVSTAAVSTAAVSTAPNFRASNQSLEPMPPTGGVASPDGQAPLARFIPPRRRTSSPQVGVRPEPAQPPAQVFPHGQARSVPPETGAIGRDWPADMTPSAAPAFLNRSEATRPGTQARSPSPLQAVFARLERAGGGDAAGIHAASEASETRASIFERLVRR